MPSTLELRELYGETWQEMKKLQELAESENRTFTEPEAQQFESFENELEDLDKRITESERVALRMDRYGSAAEMQRADRAIFEPPMMFKDADGRELRGYRHGERLSDQRGRWQDRSLDSLAHANEPHVSVGELLYGALTGNLSEHRAQSIGSVSSGGYLLSTEVSSMVIDLARSAMVSSRAGAVTLPITGPTRIVRVVGDATSQWRPEMAAITASDLTFDAIELRPKTLAVLVPISIELIEDASNAPQQIESALRASLAQEIDRAVLVGTGAASEPLGIRNDTNVNTQSSVATPAYADITTAVQNVLTANYGGEISDLAWVAHPRDWATYDGLLDSQNQPLMGTPWSTQLQRLSTTALPITEGGGSDSSMIVGDFSQVVIGMRTALTLQILDQGTAVDAAGDTFNATTQLLRFVRVHTRLDVGILRPTWFSVMTGVTT